MNLKKILVQSFGVKHVSLCIKIKLHNSLLQKLPRSFRETVSICTGTYLSEEKIKETD